jgi:hypothetical protein
MILDNIIVSDIGLPRSTTLQHLGGVSNVLEQCFSTKGVDEQRSSPYIKEMVSKAV